MGPLHHLYAIQHKWFAKLGVSIILWSSQLKNKWEGNWKGLLLLLFFTFNLSPFFYFTVQQYSSNKIFTERMIRTWRHLPWWFYMLFLWYPNMLYCGYTCTHKLLKKVEGKRSFRLVCDMFRHNQQDMVQNSKVQLIKLVS